ncbi:alpha/beta hydrolase [Naasia aerilata]|uniref:Peptidase S9 prolyl oligopeptidase catalytic domain-containing protein n=1 Tax=Naasia aerilata TaxID=1162966 RepID=A0ABM8GCZ7_9MICO|nr:prolyl oligopeptidase family serine peptidase [Naasia aerilata]BDZ46141.1 hypothetical protein GCM10025866_20500 [Naasia aerilata]
MIGDHILVLPGGGYEDLAAHEGEPVQKWLERAGVAASVCPYPVNSRHPLPLEAIRAEIRRVREAGAERIGLMGFSAGGHAAASAALAPGARPDERVDAVVLGYPVVSMELETHAGSRRALLGDEPADNLRAQTSVDRMVTPQAPPFFIWHTAPDDAVPVEHSYRLASALARAGVNHEFHVFAEGGHGLGIRDVPLGAVVWRELCERWLGTRGWLPREV